MLAGSLRSVKQKGGHDEVFVHESERGQMRRAWKRVLWVAGALAVYCGSYCVLSAMGDYRIDMTGKRRYWGTVAWMDCWHWQPKGCYMRTYIGPGGDRTTTFSGLGSIYAPLILLDRRWVHPSQYLDPADAE
jgi:hypothetical protein